MHAGVAAPPSGRSALKRSKGKEKVQEPKPKPAPKKLSKEATAYALDAARELAQNKGSKVDEKVIWRQIAGYRRMFPDLSHNYKVNPESSLSEKLGELRSVQDQLADSTALYAVQHLLLAGCSLIALANTAIPTNPLGNPRAINKLPMRIKQKMDGPAQFLVTEMKELTILYPWLFRPGPELRILLGIWETCMELKMEDEGIVMPGTSGDDAVSRLASEAEDL